MSKPTKTVYLVGHKDSQKKKDYLAITPHLEEADRLRVTIPGATFVKAVTYENR